MAQDRGTPLPDAVITDRSAQRIAPIDGELFLADPHRDREIELRACVSERVRERGRCLMTQPFPADCTSLRVREASRECRADQSPRPVSAPTDTSRSSDSGLINCVGSTERRRSTPCATRREHLHQRSAFVTRASRCWTVLSVRPSGLVTRRIFLALSMRADVANRTTRSAWSNSIVLSRRYAKHPLSPSMNLLKTDSSPSTRHISRTSSREQSSPRGGRGDCVRR